VDAVICVHEQAIDVHVSGSIRRSGNWEAHILRPFLALVKRFPQGVGDGDGDGVEGIEKKATP
jgi:hypothetical protein